MEQVKASWHPPGNSGRPLASLSLGLVASGPRSPQPCAPYTLVTTKAFLSHFGLESLRDLPDMEALEDAGLLTKETLLAADIPVAMGDEPDDDEDEVEIEGRELDLAHGLYRAADWKGAA
ncbi:Hypothetical protein NGAL_HAMBI2610_56770 [Neorhizobium galegae bv. orientalis]|nr:Hypothetical protein NGAL_HAMBI2610_56770 [Neorhizobium galegae bv. orientalis]